jgi:hypothetical protein
VLGFEHDPDTARVQLALEPVGDLDGQTLLTL